MLQVSAGMEPSKNAKAMRTSAAYGRVPARGGVIAQFNPSWTVRMRARQDLLTLQVDGTKGSAVAGFAEMFFSKL